MFEFVRMILSFEDWLFLKEYSFNIGFKEALLNDLNLPTYDFGLVPNFKLMESGYEL
jgi:hypothetical protein